MLHDVCVCDHSTVQSHTVFRNEMDLFRLLLLSNASAAQRHLSYFVQLFGGDSQVLASAQHSDPLLQEINAVMSTPRQLCDLCRLVIRSQLTDSARGCGITSLVSQLPLPRSVISYLAYVREIKSESDDEDDADIVLSFRELWSSFISYFDGLLALSLLLSLLRRHLTMFVSRAIPLAKIISDRCICDVQTLYCIFLLSLRNCVMLRMHFLFPDASDTLFWLPHWMFVL